MVRVCVPPALTTTGVFEETIEKPGVATETDWTVHEAGWRNPPEYDMVQVVEKWSPAVTVPPDPVEEVQQVLVSAVGSRFTGVMSTVADGLPPPPPPPPPEDVLGENVPAAASAPSTTTTTTTTPITA